MDSTRILLTLGAFLMTMAATTAFAQEKVELSPTQLNYNEEGVKLLVEGDYEGALNKFRSSLRLSEANVTYLNLGRTFQKMGECQKAKVAYDKAEKAPQVQQPTPAEITKVLQGYRAELPDACPTRLKLRCTPASMTVKLDDAEPMPCPGAPVDIEPGKHSLTASAYDQTIEREFEASEGESVELELVIEERVDEPVASNDDTSLKAETEIGEPESSTNVAAIALMGVGVAGLATGLILDLAILGPAIDEGENTREESVYRDNEDTFNSFRVPTLIAYGVGAAAVTGGLIWWLVSDSTETANVTAAPTRDGWAISYGTKF